MDEDLNYFSKKEKNAINNIKSRRTKILLPISKSLVKLGFTGDLISYLGFLMIIGFIYYVIKNPIMASVFLLLHVVIDGFDGPVARLRKEDGDSGAFTDILCDHTGMVVVITTLIFVSLVNPLWAIIYVYLYSLMIIFVILRNKLNLPIKVVVRTKYYVYILYAIWALFGINYLTYGLILFNILMLPSIISSYFLFKSYLRGKKDEIKD